MSKSFFLKALTVVGLILVGAQLFGGFSGKPPLGLKGDAKGGKRKKHYKFIKK
jgi:hypothetical protein